MASLQFILVTAAFLVLLLLNAALPSQTARDQYKSLKDKAYSSQTTSEATVTGARFREAIATRHRFHVPSKKPSAEKKYGAGVPELQVGCGEGFVEVAKETSKSKEKKPRRRRDAGNVRKRRDYYAWPRQVIEVPSLQSLSVWQQPPVYQISRPYFIPIWGAPGRIPIYFPPQPLLTNPGYPEDNPRKSSYPSKGYLPPDAHTIQGSANEVNFENRHNYYDDDDRPVWDYEQPASSATTQRPSPKTTTRRRRPPGRTTTPPPLVHSLKVKNVTGVNHLSTAEDSKSFAESTPILSSPPQPPPAASFRPLRPQTEESRPKTGPSKCVWAIISCCSGNADVAHSCFEQLGCPGAFWDTNPCDSDFARAAIASASNYYEN